MEIEESANKREHISLSKNLGYNECKQKRIG